MSLVTVQHYQQPLRKQQQQENYLKNGKIKYQFQRILLNASLEEKYLFSHDEILGFLKNWNGSINQNRQHYLLRANYPWLFNSKNEIKPRDNLNEHKILPIISLSEIGRKSLSAFKNVILHDKYAYIIELLTICGIFQKWTKNLMKINPNNGKYEACLVHGVNFIMKKKLMYRPNVSEEHQHQQQQIHTLTQAECSIILDAIYKNDETKIRNIYLNLLTKLKCTHEKVQKRIDSKECIKFIRTICEIYLGNNRKLITQLQGKKSAVRTAVPKRVLACRAQISLAPFLLPNQIGLPYWWAKYLNLYNDETKDERKLSILDPNLIFDVLPSKYIYNLHGQKILAKRDPIIHILAFCVFSQVYFHTDSRIKIGAESLKKMAADFDGDTFILYMIDDLKVLNELDMNGSPEYSMALHGQCRINFLESIVLCMYGRNVDFKIPHFKLYNFLRQRSKYEWLCNIRNRATLESVAKSAYHSNRQFTLDRLYSMIEPTDYILSEMLLVLYMLYGSNESYNFYKCVLKLCMQLSIEHEKSQLYQENLPCDYTLTDNLINFNLLATSLSSAKGSIHTFKSLIDKLLEKDQTTKIEKGISENITVDYDKIIADITNANVYAAKKSKQVPENGHNLFKDTIEGDLMSFGGNCLNYENKILIEHIYRKFPLQYILKPSVAYSILYKYKNV